MNDSIPLSTRRMPPDQLMELVNLYIKQPWLVSKSQAVTELFELCQDMEEQALLSSLLHRFRYITSSELRDCVDALFHQIVNGWNLQHHNTKIVAANKDAESDSSEALLYSFKRPLAGAENWSEKNLINSLAAAAKSKISNGDNVVVIDTFVGSGSQAQRRLVWLKNELAVRNCVPNKIFLCSIARLEIQTFDLAELLDEFYSLMILPKGISDHFDGVQKSEAIARMMRLEGEIRPQRGSKYFPFGFEQSEALYSIEDWNGSNNVFPIFWWKKLRSGRLRKTVIDRL